MKAAAKMSQTPDQAPPADNGQLAAELVHNFNNILNVIGGYLELMNENSHAPEAIARYLAKARQAVANGSSMTSLVAAQLPARVPTKTAPMAPTRSAEKAK